MDIAALSMEINQLKPQTSAGIEVTKMAMDTNKEAGTRMTEMMNNYAVDPNLGNHIDVSA